MFLHHSFITLLLGMTGFPLCSWSLTHDKKFHRKAGQESGHTSSAPSFGTLNKSLLSRSLPTSQLPFTVKFLRKRHQNVVCSSAVHEVKTFHSYLPFPLSFSHKCTVKSSRSYMMSDIAPVYKAKANKNPADYQGSC